MTTRPIKVIGIDKSGRLDCALDALKRSARPTELYVLSEVSNPGLTSKAIDVRKGKTDNADEVVAYAKQVRPDFVFIGPEEPLAAAVVDRLKEIGIPAIGPTKSLARVETSKSFTRELLKEFGIPGNPTFRTFESMSGMRAYLDSQKDFVVKPDGLTGGKGVRVSGEHLHDVDEAVRYCEEVFGSGQKAIVIEEKLEGEEFSLQSFCDGRHIYTMPPVQDHKRARDGDRGPNTGGMGSYSCEDHLLPFLRREHIEEASRINFDVMNALREKTGEEYKGILYGSFILTRDGLRVIEYNARFGDPEIMNVLPLLNADFVGVCDAMIAGRLNEVRISFKRKATVCKYVVPKGYPDKPVKGQEIQLADLPPSDDSLRLYYAAIEEKDGKLLLTGSRAFAVLGIGNTVAEAERIAEDAARKVKGPVFHRADIGTTALIARRVSHIAALCGVSPSNFQRAKVAV